MSIRKGNDILAGSYEVQTLPQATETDLGGVKAAPASADYTQEVKINVASGKLYIKPSTNYSPDETTIKSDQEILSAIGLVNKNELGPVAIFDWVGTKAQYEADYSASKIDPQWVCYITDDTSGGNLDGLIATVTELNYLQGLTGNVQAQINATNAKFEYPDEDTIGYNADHEFEVKGIKDVRTNNTLKEWTGTKAQYDAIATKDANTLYNITDDENEPLVNNEVTVPQFRNMFEMQWSDHILTDMSWVRGDLFNWHNGTTYSNAYQHLVNDIAGISIESEVVGGITINFYRALDGHKICNPSEESKLINLYNNEGIAWYYILDTVNQRFKLPRTKFNFKPIRTQVGQMTEESLPNIKGKFQLGYDYPVMSYLTDGAFYSTDIGGADKNGATEDTGRNRQTAFDASRSSTTYQDGAYVQERATQMYLYFYVGEFTQSALEQTAGLNSELFIGKADIDSFVEIDTIIEEYVSGTSGYRIWSSGYCEQWGQASSLTSGAWVIIPITFLKEFADTNYCITTSHQHRNYQVNTYDHITIYGLTTTGFVINAYSYASESIDFWRACGYLKDGEF